MGIADFSTPYIRDNKSARNANLKDIKVEKSSGKSDFTLVIGFDISVNYVKIMSTASNIVAKYHCDPLQPLEEVALKVVNMLKPYFKNGMDTGILVFDGLTNKLKREKAHIERYSKVEQNQERLAELYRKTSFKDETEEKEILAEVRKLRGQLCPMREDIIYAIIDKVQSTFGDKMRWVGSPFEADHQLAGLFKQKIIDLTVTVDSDLVCLGSDVIYSMSTSGSCWFTSLGKLLQERLAEKFDTDDGVKWTKQVLYNVACFLGNDYIKRVPGNGPGKVMNFVNTIGPVLESAEDASIDPTIKDFFIDSSTKSTRDDKLEWMTEEKRTKHLTLWKQAYQMFQHGPAFVVTPTNDSTLPRQAFLDRDYTVSLGSFSTGSSSPWYSDDGKTLTLGYDPVADLIDAIERNTCDYLPDIQGTERTAILIRECFDLQRWSKTGRMISELKAPVDNSGNELYHGSIIDFEAVPVIYHSIQCLKFYLESRQVRAPTRARDIRALVTTIHTSHGSVLKPIPKIMMRGVSGWLGQEILVKGDDKDSIEWLRGNELISALLDINPKMTEDGFTIVFGKRNGTRLRCLKHIQGGSFNLSLMKGTFDMVRKENKDMKLFVLETSCAPSQKLKEDGKDSFHNLRLCMELNEHKQFSKYCTHPTTSCGCPNGCIPCAHKGAAICLLHSILHFCKKYKERQAGENGSADESNVETNIPTFEEIERHFPPPVHELLKIPITTDYMFPSPGSKNKSSENEFNIGEQSSNERNIDLGDVNDETREGLRQIPNILEKHENDRAELELEIEANDEIADLREFMEEQQQTVIAIPGTDIMDNSIQSNVLVIKKTEKWSEALLDGRDDRGREVTRIDDVDDYTTKMANHLSSEKYVATQLKFLERLEIAFEKKKCRDDEWKASNPDKDDDTREVPILSHVLECTKSQRHDMQDNLRQSHPDESLELHELVPKDF